MLTPTRWTIRILIAAVVCAALPGAVQMARADNIAFQLASNSLTTTNGGTVSFLGTVTNDSGTDLNASDFFLNFSNYDFTSVNPNQDLGIVSNFLIPNGTTTSAVDLFSVTVGTVPAGSIFNVDAQLEDVNSDLSLTQTVSVSVPVVPEPSVLSLAESGLIGLLVLRSVRRPVGRVRARQEAWSRQTS